MTRAHPVRMTGLLPRKTRSAPKTGCKDWLGRPIRCPGSKTKATKKGK